ncbi:MAG: hypothetical protein LBK58_04775 [Prevotellaceae bacterium]|jgi:hypothetical protein|nr:hypothetical protein [Prevotellaceae bacterium]
MTAEHKIKIGNSVRETYTDYHRQAISRANKGKPLSDEHKQKISISCRSYWQKVKELLNEQKQLTK